MAKKISVILLEDVAGVGTAGDIASVSEGYARNSLFPNGSAAIADEGRLKAIDKKMAKQAAADDSALTKHQETAKALDGTELTITAKVKEGEGSELYGKITASAIAKELQAQAKLKLKAKDIGLAEAITAIGSYDVQVQIADDVEATIKVTVTAANPEDVGLGEED
jgi:large subunit ribosomal protein L9